MARERRRSRRTERLCRAEGTTKAAVKDIYKNCRTIIVEFVEDGVVVGFRDIPIHVWYNALSAICALALRAPEIKGDERLQEAVVYQVMLMVIRHDLPIDDDAKKTVEGVYARVAPTIIDVLIPGKRGCGCSLL